MEIRIEGASQYVLYLLALCGEVEYSIVLNNGLYAEGYMANVISRMQKEQLVRKVTLNREERKYTLLRLCDPKGAQRLLDLSPALSSHYDLMAGMPGDRLKGTASHRLRLLKMGMLTSMFYQSGCMVDYFTHRNVQPEEKERRLRRVQEEEGDQTGGSQSDFLSSFIREKTIYSPDGNLLAPTDIFSRLGKNDTCFFTSRSLSNQALEIYKNRRNIMNRMYGILAGGENLYNVYFLFSAGEMWWRDVERQAMAVTQRYIRNMFPDREQEEGSAIFYVKEEDVIKDIFFPPKKVKSRVVPSDVYAHSYMLPLTANHTDIRTMLLTPDWESKIKQLLMKEHASQKADLCDGRLNGYETYILLGSDLTKMMEIIPRVKARPSLLIIHAWQEDLVNALYPAAEKIIFTTEDFEGLVETLQVELEDYK